MFRVCAGAFIVVVNLSVLGHVHRAHAQSAPEHGGYYTRIQSIFDNRCIACHSCYNAPCQLNLQTYSGLTRGATKLNVYQGSRPTSVAPTRLDIDGHSAADWRAKGFFDVVGDNDPARTLLMQLVALRARHPLLAARRGPGAVPQDGQAASSEPKRGLWPFLWLLLLLGSPPAGGPQYQLKKELSITRIFFLGSPTLATIRDGEESKRHS